MRRLITIGSMLLIGCGGGQPAKSASDGPKGAGTDGTAAESGEPTRDGDGDGDGAAASEADPSDPDAPRQFEMLDTHTAKQARGVKASKLKPTKTEAVLKFIVVDKQQGPIEGVVVLLISPDGKKYYTEESDAKGYTEVLVPNGKKYQVVYLALGGKDIAATLPVDPDPNLTMKLTLRYKSYVRPPAGKPPERGLVLEGVHFDTGKATIRPESFEQLDSVVEYLTHKKSVRIEISGHTDNVGNKKKNKTLSENRAKACKDYLVSKGIDASRIEAVGYGDERPSASNDDEAGRQKNRRIEAKEL